MDRGRGLPDQCAETGHPSRQRRPLSSPVARTPGPAARGRDGGAQGTGRHVHQLCPAADRLAFMTDVRFGALCWNQYTDWPALLEAGIRADRLGYDTLWTWDHLYPIVGDPQGPNYEGWLTLAAWAQATRARPDRPDGRRQPVPRAGRSSAKMATTLDHISNGRAILGIGAAWFESEAQDYGFEFGRAARAAALARRGAARDARHARRPEPRRRPAHATRATRAQPARHRSRSACRSASVVAARR